MKLLTLDSARVSKDGPTARLVEADCADQAKLEAFVRSA